MSGISWDGSGTQEELMHRDECVLVNERDELVGHASKYDCHRFDSETPRGRLHRAFSVFLFDSEDRLLLQQRAGDKITFPGVWTNTCCSHPLHGHSPSEVDAAAAVAAGTVPGVKAAAVRKLRHELGIPAEQVPTDKFRFLTRLHYCAGDVETYGQNPPWGEHELDYILFIKADVDLSPNPEEVQDVKYVTFPELQKMLTPGNGLMWSPWFRIIAKHFLGEWWKDLETTLNTIQYVEVDKIHYLEA